jgi:hypothetical protein
MVAAHGNAELKLRLRGGDKGNLTPANAFSFAPTTAYADDERIALYFWGQRVWGNEPA